MQKKFIAVLLILLVFAFPLFSFAASKVIVSADFNTKEKKGFVEDAYFKDEAKYYWSENEGRDGSGCLVVECTTENDARYAYTVKAKKNTYYRISAYIKTENVSYKDENAKGANLSIKDLFDVHGNIFGTQDWTYVEFYGLTGSSQTSFTVFLRLGGYGGTNTGKAYFDDFKVEELDSLPVGAEVTALYKESSANNDFPPMYTDPMRVAGLLTFFSAIVFIIYYRYVTRHKDAVQEGLSTLQKVVLLLFIGLFLRLILSITAPQCSIDVNLFSYWATNAAKHNFNIYNQVDGIDYPPGYMTILMLVGKIMNLFNAYGTLLGRMLIKMPAILCDIAIAYIIYKLAVKKLSSKWTIFLVCAWLFNPVVLIDSAAWGQVDSVLTLAMVLCIYYITQEKYATAGVWLAVAVMLKPQALFISPILFYALVKHFTVSKEPIVDKLLHFVKTLCAFLVTFLLIALPYWVNMKSIWLYELFLGTADHYDYITVNALNYHFLKGNNWVRDSTPSVFGWSLFAWGMLAIVAASVITWVVYQINKKEKSVPYLMSAVLIYLVVNFGPRMHERYFFPLIALMLIALIYINNKWLLYLFAVTSGVNFLIVMEIMTDLTVGGSGGKYRHFNWPHVTTFRGTLAFINVTCSVLLLVFAVMHTMKLFKGDSHLLWKDKTEEMIVPVSGGFIDRIKNKMARFKRSDIQEWSVDNEKKN